MYLVFGMWKKREIGEQCFNGKEEQIKMEKSDGLRGLYRGNFWQRDWPIDYNICLDLLVEWSKLHSYTYQIKVKFIFFYFIQNRVWSTLVLIPDEMY